MFKLSCMSLFIFLPVICHAASAGRELSILEVLKRAEEFDPRLKGSRFQEQAAEENISVQKSNYMPNLSAAAVASTGNPGSFSMFDVDSEISSTQRVGAGGALVLKQNLWDFGRTLNAVDTAKGQKEVEKKRFAILKVDVDVLVLRTYIGCAFLRAQVENSRFMAQQAKLLANETDKFVRSGQRSVIERYLVDAEAKEAETRIAEFSERVTATQKRLAIELGSSTEEQVICSDLSSVGSALDKLEKKSGKNPLLDFQKARVQVARSRLDQANAESRPVLYGMATGGYFDDKSLKDKTIYAAGVGIKLPLFEGFRIDSTIRQNQAQLSAEEAGLDSSRLNIDRVNSQYEEQILALKTRLDFLEKEKKLAKEVFALAKKRYGSLQGTMVDLRESIRNMNRVLQSTDEAYRDLFIAKGERSLVNGSRTE
ncbi:MAG: TolC family protein [Bdellovibrionales bacterium]